MSSFSLDRLEVCCTWSIANERNIKEAVTIESSHNKEVKSDVDDLVKLETCVQLFSPNSSFCSPELKFNITPDLNISAVRIVSEARIIELYGRGGEYLFTKHSDFVDDFEGMAVYSTFLNLDVPSPECSLKFNKLKHQDNFWLYGIGVYVEECKDYKSSCANVDLKSVSDRLRQSGCNLTENAGQCMQLLQTFQTLGRSTSKNAGQISNLAGYNSVMTSEASRRLHDFLLLMPTLQNGSKTQANSASAVSEELKMLSLSDSASTDLQVYISEQFKKLEETLMGKLDERLNVIEQKLDLLLSHIPKGDLDVQSDKDMKK